MHDDEFKEQTKLLVETVKQLDEININHLITEIKKRSGKIKFEQPSTYKEWSKYFNALLSIARNAVTLQNKLKRPLKILLKEMLSMQATSTDLQSSN